MIQKLEKMIPGKEISGLLFSLKQVNNILMKIDQVIRVYN